MTDKELLDKLEKFVINARKPLLHGSLDRGWYNPPFDEEGFPDGGPTIRQWIEGLPACE